MAVFERLSSGGDGEGRSAFHVVGWAALGAGAARWSRRGIPRGREMHGGGVARDGGGGRGSDQW